VGNKGYYFDFFAASCADKRIYLIDFGYEFFPGE
jgi:hypothetical protein